MKGSDSQTTLPPQHSTSVHANVDRPLPAIPGRRAECVRSDDQELSRRPGASGRILLAGARLDARSPRRSRPPICAATSPGCMKRATRRRPSRDGSPRCGASSASGSAKAGPTRTPPSRSAIRGSRDRCRISSRPKNSAACSKSPPANDRQGIRDRAILETLYSAGLRVSELVALNDDDVDHAACVLHVRGKGKRERLAPIGSFAMKASSSIWQSASPPSARPRERA